MWDLPADVRGAIAADLEKNFAFLFEQLRVTGTRAITDRFVRPPLQSHAQPRPVAVAAPDDLEAGGGGSAGRGFGRSRWAGAWGRGWGSSSRPSRAMARRTNRPPNSPPSR